MAKTRRTTTTRKPATRKAAAPASSLHSLRVKARRAMQSGVTTAEGLRGAAVGRFEALLAQGASLEQQGRKLAASKVRAARKAIAAGATLARNRTTGAVSQLERAFEQRVSRAISKLGVPSTKEVRALTRQVAQLQASVETLRRSRARAA